MSTLLPSSFNPKQYAGGVIIIILVCIILGSAAASMFTFQTNQNKPSGPTSGNLSITPVPFSSSLLIYGYWEPGKSHVNAFDISSQKTSSLAVLSENIKHVSILQKGQLLYVGNTDTKDYGSEVDLYSLKDTTSVTLLKADPGFGIDDYVVSPNGSYLAEYEIQLAPGNSVVLGGNERIYSLDLSRSGQKQLVYSSAITKPIPYPIGITNGGRIIFDTWLPNSGFGWAYGMSVSDITGANKQDIASMPNGTYGGQPMLSSDANQFVFTGYDGSQGDGTATDSAGQRRALSMTNTVELLDTNTLNRKKLPNLPSNTLYDEVKFDPTSGNLIIDKVTGNIAATDVYFYNLQTGSSVKVPTTNEEVLASLSPGAFLLGTPDLTDQTIGSLGNSYQFSYTSFTLLDSTNNATHLSVPGNLKQFIALLPAGFLSQQALSQLRNATVDTLQMSAFDIKPSLAQTRENQQNAPIDTQANHNQYIRYKDTERRREERKVQYKKGKDCKPAIYLYPTSTQDISVRVSINGILGYTNPNYGQDGWHVTADPSGTITYQNRTFDYLFYEAQIPDSFLSAENLQNTGFVVEYSQLQKLFGQILPELGLNAKEAKAFSDYWVKALPVSTYYEVSVVPQSVSDTFAPLTITPVPDSILRVSLYFQPLDQKIIIPKPSLPEVKQRTGFSVVEWGGLFKSDANHPFTCLM